MVCPSHFPDLYTPLSCFWWGWVMGGHQYVGKSILLPTRSRSPSGLFAPLCPLLAAPRPGLQLRTRFCHTVASCPSGSLLWLPLTMSCWFPKLHPYLWVASSFTFIFICIFLRENAMFPALLIENPKREHSVHNTQQSHSPRFYRWGNSKCFKSYWRFHLFFSSFVCWLCHSPALDLPDETQRWGDPLWSGYYFSLQFKISSLPHLRPMCSPTIPN